MANHLPTNRIEALDGLRGLAVISVVIHHGCYLSQTSDWKTTWNWVVGLGGLGGNMFMMLSGFLITVSLLKRSDTGDWRSVLARHYVNRFVRIYPMYFLSLIVICLVMPVVYEMALGKPDFYFRPSIRQFLLYATVLTNVKVANQHFSHPFDVTWTIGVLEQVYIVWIPLCLFLCKRTLVVAAGLGIAATTIMRIVASQNDVPYHVFHVLPCFRADAILIGGLIAIGVRTGRLPKAIPALNILTVLTSIVFVALMFSCSNQGPMWRIRFCYPAMNFVSLMWLLTSIGCSSSSWLSIWVGGSIWRSLAKHSYLIYLVHMPSYSLLFPICRWLVGRPPYETLACDIISVAAGLLNIPVSFGLAVLVYYLVERPIDRWREKLGTKSVEVTVAPDTAKIPKLETIVDQRPVRAAETV